MSGNSSQIKMRKSDQTPCEKLALGHCQKTTVPQTSSGSKSMSAHLGSSSKQGLLQNPVHAQILKINDSGVATLLATAFLPLILVVIALVYLIPTHIYVYRRNLQFCRTESLKIQKQLQKTLHKIEFMNLKANVINAQIALAGAQALIPGLQVSAAAKLAKLNIKAAKLNRKILKTTKRFQTWWARETHTWPMKWRLVKSKISQRTTSLLSVKTSQLYGYRRFFQFRKSRLTPAITVDLSPKKNHFWKVSMKWNTQIWHRHWLKSLGIKTHWFSQKGQCDVQLKKENMIWKIRISPDKLLWKPLFSY